MTVDKDLDLTIGVDSYLHFGTLVHAIPCFTIRSAKSTRRTGEE
jgi:hypothetical protein